MLADCELAGGRSMASPSAPHLARGKEVLSAQQIARGNGLIIPKSGETSVGKNGPLDLDVEGLAGAAYAGTFERQN
jgi:hypothetical protein